MNDNDNDDTAAELMRRCLDGIASDDDVARINQVLVHLGPSSARALVGVLRFENALEDAVCSVAKADEVAPPSRRAGGSRRVLPTLGVAAGVAAMACVWLLVIRPGAAVRQPVASGNRPASIAPAAAEFHPSPRVLQLTDGSNVGLRDSDAEVAVRTTKREMMELALIKGGARFDVVPLPYRLFRVRAGTVVIDVLGTIFTVERAPTGVRVSVERGLVRVSSPSGERHIAAGHTEWFADAPSVSLDSTSEPTSPPPRLVPARQRSRTRPAAYPAGPPPLAPTAAPIGPATVEQPDVVGDLLQRSSAERVAGHPDGAVKVLRALVESHPRDPRAPYAAFMMGRVLLEEMDRPREAALAFAQVRDLDPRTPLDGDALAREVEAWARAGDDENSKRSAQLYISRYPRGARLEAVRSYSHSR